MLFRLSGKPVNDSMLPEEVLVIIIDCNSEEGLLEMVEFRPIADEE